MFHSARVPSDYTLECCVIAPKWIEIENQRNRDNFEIFRMAIGTVSMEGINKLNLI